MVWMMRHRQTKGPDTDRPDLNNRATSRLYSFLAWLRAIANAKAAAFAPCIRGDSATGTWNGKRGLRRDHQSRRGRS
jgi:hypothetical protein